MIPMKLHAIDYPFVLLTPCFSGGAGGKDGPSAMRVPAIRGQLREWHRMLFNNANANEVWGSAAGSDGSSSRVALSLLGSPPSSDRRAPVLPHKYQSGRAALTEGTCFVVRLQRLVHCRDDDWKHAGRAMRTWLLAGCLGYRANRAAGSVWPADGPTPDDPGALASELRTLGLRLPLRISDPPGQFNALKLRETASDTVSIPRFFGDAGNTRKPSPIRFKVVSFRGGASLLATVVTPPAGGGGPLAEQVLEDGLAVLSPKPCWSGIHWLPL